MAALAVCMIASCTAAASADQAGVPLLPCGEGATGSVNCNPSKHELKQAKSAYDKGLKLQREHQADEALAQFEKAAQLAPRAVDYLTAREMARQQLVYEHMERGNADLLQKSTLAALGEFRAALHLDPDNSFAQQRMRDALGDSAPKLPEQPQVVESSAEIQLAPKDIHADFHFTDDSKALLTNVANVYGITATLDSSVMSHRVRFDITGVDFYSAMRAASIVTHTFWTTLSSNQILIANDTQENHRQYDRLGLRTFYVPGATTPQALNEVLNMVRTVFEVRFASIQAQSSTIEIRAPLPILQAATQFIEGLGESRPELLLDVNVYEVSHTLTRNMGLHIPNQFNLFNIPAAALAALGGQNISDLVNQLISSGGINQANSQALSGLLAQLGSQQNSIFSQPLATFGNGLTLFGLSLDQVSAQLSMNESSVKTLEHATLRASQGADANLHIGTRYPILNASFAPIFNTPAIAQNIQNNTFQSAFPSFNYEDLGLTIKAKPAVNAHREVSLALEMQVRALGTTTLNGVPVITNREYKGSIGLEDGEPAVVAGAINNTEMRSLSGIPGLGMVPGLNRVTASNTLEHDEDELLILITPHVISLPTQTAPEAWVNQ